MTTILTPARASVNWMAPADGTLQQLIDAGEWAEYRRICAEERAAETLYWQGQRLAAKVEAVHGAPFGPVESDAIEDDYDCIWMGC